MLNFEAGTTPFILVTVLKCADAHCWPAGSWALGRKSAIKALQTADAFEVATPADWRPGDRVIVPPAASCDVAADRMGGAEEGIECEDWFFCTKEISEEDVESAIRCK